MLTMVLHHPVLLITTTPAVIVICDSHNYCSTVICDLMYSLIHTAPYVINNTAVSKPPTIKVDMPQSKVCGQFLFFGFGKIEHTDTRFRLL